MNYVDVARQINGLEPLYVNEYGPIGLEIGLDDRTPENPVTPQEKLMLGMLDLAFKDVAGMNFQNKELVEKCDDALEWMNETSKEYMTDFSYIAEYFDRDPRHLRKAILNKAYEYKQASSV